MPTRCVKIGLRAGCLAEVEAWSAELARRADEVRDTLRAEGVSLEAAFLDEGPGGAALVYVIRADDFERMARVAAASDAAIDRLHRAFKARCWLERTPLRTLLDASADPAPAGG